MNVIDAIREGRYKNTVPYSVDRVPIDENRMTVRQAREHAEAEKARHRAQRELHRAEEARLDRLFRADLEEEHGLAGHPKAELLFDIAWDDAHSDGYEQIAYRYERLAGLLAP